MCLVSLQQSLSRSHREIHLLVCNKVVGTVSGVEIQQDNWGVSPAEKWLRQEVEMQRKRRGGGQLKLSNGLGVGRDDVRRLDRQSFPRIRFKGHSYSIA
jgi:hypothetical protein